MGYKPTYRPTIDITKRFNEFLVHATSFYNGMIISTEMAVDKYFRGEISIKELCNNDAILYIYIIKFEKYECENGEYKYIPEIVKDKEYVKEMPKSKWFSWRKSNSNNVTCTIVSVKDDTLTLQAN